MAKDYPDGFVIAPHSHPRGQLLYAITGLMRVMTGTTGWIVPPFRAVWIPPGIRHQVSMQGPVQMRTLYLSPGASIAIPKECTVIDVSRLLRELILSAVDEALDYDPQGRGGLIMNLILLEIPRAHQVPLQIPMPTDPRLVRLCRALLDRPHKKESFEVLARRTGASSRTLMRLFQQDLGMSFVIWRQQVLLSEAVALLASGKTVKEVATTLGYQSPSAFTAMFRQNLGKAPESYLHSPE
ncbi:AraC family transcriptional regulator [Geothrix limicola]|nr:helix-turn-helix transcriptional regulator [Geothrix limicola]